MCQWEYVRLNPNFDVDVMSTVNRVVLAYVLKKNNGTEHQINGKEKRSDAVVWQTPKRQKCIDKVTQRR